MFDATFFWSVMTLLFRRRTTRKRFAVTVEEIISSGWNGQQTGKTWTIITVFLLPKLMTPFPFLSIQFSSNLKKARFILLAFGPNANLVDIEFRRCASKQILFLCVYERVTRM